MKNKIIIKWWILTISIFCITNQNSFAQFGNNFIFSQTSLDYQSMVKQEGIFLACDSCLFSALENLDPFGYAASMGNPGVKTIRVFMGDSLKDDFKDSTYVAGNETDIIGHGKPKSPIILGVKLNPKLENCFSANVNSISKSYNCYTINDSSDAILIALGITTENVSEYKYRVVVNDSAEIIPWSPIPKLEQKHGAIRPYAFFGKFNAPGKQLLIEVVNRNNYSIRDGVIFDWRINYKPVVTQIIVSTPSGYFNLNYKKLNRDYATKFDAISGLPLNLKFPVDSIDNLRLNFKSHPTIPFVVYLKQDINGKIETKEVDYWLTNDYFDLSKDNFKTPGKYELIVQRVQTLENIDEANILRIPFEVFAHNPIEKKFSARQIFPYALVLIVLIITAFLIYYLRNKRKLSKSIRLKEKTELMLKSIHSQLNPHFMFNALSSIQNLMDRNETSAANNYLSIFSSLTRKVLNTSEQELISLEDEISLLDNYLQMEQLRFGFQYSINIESGLNKANIEIPAMLLQPMVENAVKHGVSGMRDKGRIDVAISSSNLALILSVSDNGKGFDKAKTTETAGLGLKLSKERITLLNNIYPKQLITIEFISVDKGAKIAVKLNDWL